MKRKFIVTIWSSKEDLKLKPEKIQYEIYENSSDLDTVEVKEIEEDRKIAESTLEWINIIDKAYSFAYHFVKNNKEFLDFLKEETSGYIDWLNNFVDENDLYNWIEKIAKEWGGDYELINEVLKNFYPPPKYFFLISFTKCEDFRVRVWQLIDDNYYYFMKVGKKIFYACNKHKSSMQIELNLNYNILDEGWIYSPKTTCGWCKNRE